MQVKRHNQPQRRPKEDKIKGHRLSLKLPKAVKRREWKTANQDVTKVLEPQVGTAEEKLENISDIIYHYGQEHFGVNIRKPVKAIPPTTKSRRQQEIDGLVRERRELRKQ